MEEAEESDDDVEYHGHGLREAKEHTHEEDEIEEMPAVIHDNGSGNIKAGFAGDQAPKVNMSAVVGYPHRRPGQAGDPEECYIGDEAQEKRGVLMLRYPTKVFPPHLKSLSDFVWLQHGIVENWDDMAKIWRYTWENQLRVSVGGDDESLPASKGVLMTEAPFNPTENREMMLQVPTPHSHTTFPRHIPPPHSLPTRCVGPEHELLQTIFEEFGSPRFHSALQGELSLYSSGRTTGVAVDSGDGVTHLVPIYMGYSVEHQIVRSNIAGGALTEFLCSILQDSDIVLTTSAERESARHIKECAPPCSIALSVLLGARRSSVMWPRTLTGNSQPLLARRSHSLSPTARWCRSGTSRPCAT